MMSLISAVKAISSRYEVVDDSQNISRTSLYAIMEIVLESETIREVRSWKRPYYHAFEWKGFLFLIHLYW